MELSLGNGMDGKRRISAAIIFKNRIEHNVTNLQGRITGITTVIRMVVGPLIRTSLANYYVQRGAEYVDKCLEGHETPSEPTTLCLT